MPVRVCTGFEIGYDNAGGSWEKGNAGVKFADLRQGAPNHTTSTPRSGSRCLEINQSAAVEHLGWDTNTLGASQTRCVLNVWIRFPTLPSADVDIANIWTAGGDINLVFVNATDKLRINNESGGQNVDSAGSVVAATWYHVEIKVNCAAGGGTTDWTIDGTAQTQNANTPASTTIAAAFCGGENAQTMHCLYDDLVIWTDTADISGYPFGKHSVKLLKADTGGTAVEIGTANATARFTANGTIDSTFNSANILAALAEVPPTIGASANGVAQRTSGSGNACGIPMTTYTLAGGESFVGPPRLVICGWAGSTTANNFGIRVFNGTTEDIIFAVADPNFDNNTTQPGWVCEMLSATNYDTQGEIDALVVRLGYSTDIAPNPGAHGVFAEIAVKEATGVDLVIADLTQGQTLDNIAMTQVHELVINALTQGQNLDNLTMTQVHELVIAALTQAQTLENLTVDSSTNLVIADLTQAQTLDNAVLTQVHELVINALTQAQNLDNLTMTQIHQLVINALIQEQNLGNLTLTQVHQLVIAALTQAQTLDNLTVNSATNLAIADLTQAQNLGNLTMTQVHELVIAALTQAQTLGSLTLTQVHQLAISPLVQAQNIDSLVLTQLHQLVIASLTQGQLLDNLVVIPGPPAPTLRPTIDVVAVALIRELTGIPASRVDTTLPKETVLWGDGFVQAVGTSEESGMYVPLHTSIINVSCWATNIGSGKPPWGKANQLAETIKVLCLDHSNFPVTLDLSPFGGYGPARVHSAYFISEPHRIPSDEGSFARYDGDLVIHWVPL